VGRWGDAECEASACVTRIRRLGVVPDAVRRFARMVACAKNRRKSVTRSLLAHSGRAFLGPGPSSRLSMAFRFTIAAKNLSWPAVCACCRAPSDGILRSSVSVSKGKRVVRTTTRGWDVPYCSACMGHRACYESADKWLGGGLLLGAAVAVLLLMQGSLLVGVALGGLVFLLSVLPFQATRNKARAAMRSTCAVPWSAVTYQGWHGSEHRFEFENKTYMEEFLDQNWKKRRSIVEGL
jgi:hypothetical protein